MSLVLASIAMQKGLGEEISWATDDLDRSVPYGRLLIGIPPCSRTLYLCDIFSARNLIIITDDPEKLRAHMVSMLTDLRDRLIAGGLIERDTVLQIEKFLVLEAANENFPQEQKKDKKVEVYELEARLVWRLRKMN